MSASIQIDGKEFEVSETDLVEVEALQDGFCETEVKRFGEKFFFPGKYFQNGVPSWVKIIAVRETDVELVETVKAGKVKKPKELTK